MSKITTFLTFESNGKAAVEYYVSIFKNSKLNYAMTIPGDERLYSASFTLDGVDFMAMDAGPHFQFSEGMSLFVSCEDQAEVDHFWAALTANGGQESRCGWLKDPWGVSWQIIPKQLGQLMGDPDQEKSGRVMQAMLAMNKLDVAGLQAAYDGK